MEVVFGSERLAGSAPALAHPPPPASPSAGAVGGRSGERAIAIGNFDGMHLGHRQVLSRLADLAGARGLPTWVYTFDPPPTMVIAPERHQPRLVTLTRKLELLDGLGITGVVVEAFTPAFAAQSAESFARLVLRDRLGAAVVVVGWDFRFGSGRGGDSDALRAAARGLEVEQVAPFVMDGAPVSSSRIRRLIIAGSVEEAAKLLGRPHRLSGTVVHGDARGRTIGVPTANLQVDVECLPAAGVYAVSVGVPSGAPGGGRCRMFGVLNVGVRPTFNGSELRVEAHVLDWDGDLYGQHLDLDLVARIREERRFPSVDALLIQIRQDIAAARGLG
ncbi:MAG: bifunctional riboflavin kinase/FAD synthetase [Myxococcales bacterium]|nr:bifunctional riboflavin kinase/FAD synthetase [Myxococcales bacterium]